MKTRPGICLLVLFLSSIAFGCTAPKKMYYWGDYSNSLYRSCKEPTEENLLKHRQVLDHIIEESGKQDLRVPPGVYAELGYIHFRQNNGVLAVKFFDLEERTYPESKVLMQRLSQAARAMAEASTKEKEAGRPGKQ